MGVCIRMEALLARGKVSTTWELGFHRGGGRCLDGSRQWEGGSLGGSTQGGQILGVCEKEAPSGEWNHVNGQWAWPATEGLRGQWRWGTGGLSGPSLAFRLLTLAPNNIIYIVSGSFEKLLAKGMILSDSLLQSYSRFSPYLKACFRRRQEPVTSMECRLHIAHPVPAALSGYLFNPHYGLMRWISLHCLQWGS